VVVSDSMMFQRGDPSPSDRHLGSFYGLALPLVKRGIPAEPVQLENATIPGALAHVKVLLLTYEGMKPMTPDVHDALAGWVKAGGALVFVGDDGDAYNGVRAWWNDSSKGRSYLSPREHLFEALGLPKELPAGAHAVGKGALVYDTSSPAALTYRRDGADLIRGLVRRACGRAGLDYAETNHLTLRRGPYVVAAGLDESLSGPPHVLRGRFIDLFDAGLPVVTEATLTPGSRRLLLDLDRVKSRGPVVLASSFKALGAKAGPDGSFTFYAEGPDKVEGVARVLLDSEPKGVSLDGQPLPAEARAWDPAAKTLLLRFPNSAAGHWVTVR
jgi:hypothetical protein